MRKFVLPLLLAGTIATPALAQEAAPFDGARIEGIIGYDRVGVEDEGADGVTYGVGVGYDVQRGRTVFGVEGEFGNSSADECVADVDVVGDELCANIGREFYVGGRIGAAVAPRTLLYVKAGYANTRARLVYDDGTVATDDFNVRRNLDGIRAGAGAEFALGTNAYLRTEYRYTNYEDGIDRHQVVGGFGFRF